MPANTCLNDEHIVPARLHDTAARQPAPCSSNTKIEGEIRQAFVEAALVKCMLALPGQLN